MFVCVESACTVCVLVVCVRVCFWMGLSCVFVCFMIGILLLSSICIFFLILDIILNFNKKHLRIRITHRI